MCYYEIMKDLNERQKNILSLLEENQTIEVSALIEILYASAATVRRDLKKLEDKGLILRTHGRAVSTRQYSGGNTAFDTRMLLASEAKDRMAATVAEKLVQTGDVVMLDASSTVAHTVEYLKAKNVTAITSGIQTLSLLAGTDLDFYSTGGRAVKGSYSLVGQSAIEYVGTFNADICIVSCHGLTPSGYVCDTSQPELELRRAMMKHSKKSVLLIDSSKFEKTYTYNMCHISEFDYVICDKPLPDNISNKCDKATLVMTTESQVVRK